MSNWELAWLRRNAREHVFDFGQESDAELFATFIVPTVHRLNVVAR
jgi:hypothetical protein